MQSIGLALTLSMLTSTLVLLDLTDGHTGSAPQTQAQAAQSFDAGNRLAIMPNSLQGIFVPKADIRNGVFAVGSSTGREGLDDDSVDGDEDSNADHDEDHSDEAVATPVIGADKARNFVLI